METETCQLDKVAEGPDVISDGVPAVTSHQIIVGSHHHNVQGSGLRSVEVVEFESMAQGLNICSCDGNVVHVHEIACIGGACGAWGSKKLVQCAIRDNNFNPVLWVRVGEMESLT